MDFVAFCRCSQTSPRCASLALKHYLLKPVQRIPQYQLLLTGTLRGQPLVLGQDTRRIIPANGFAFGANVTSLSYHLSPTNLISRQKLDQPSDVLAAHKC